MKTEDFEFLRKFLYDRSGLSLTPDKSYLLESRLAPIARRLKHKALSDLIDQMRVRADEALTIEVVEAMTTNETLFFRDRWPFERFSQMILPALLEANKATKRIRIWCAACSSGQEPYSLAMLLAEAGHLLGGWQVELIGTDISEEMLDRCRKGWYSAFEVQRGMTPELLKKYFIKDNDGWLISDKLRAMVKFRNFNLLADPSASGVGLSGLDLIFCRNVLIYFDETTRRQVFSGMAKAMKPAGFLCLGGAETVIGISDAFRILPGERGLFAVNAPGGAAGAAAPAQVFTPRPAIATAPTAPAPAVAGVAPRAPITAFASRPAVAATPVVPRPAAPPVAPRPATAAAPVAPRAGSAFAPRPATPAAAPAPARSALDPRPIEAMLAAVARLG
ncbi:MAG: protein-glutamate O-methyltransferase CheR [Parvibaculum sp.]|nr:protein-glutamate O-methyltransferase CheR [Parvibaculum sp.]